LFIYQKAVEDKLKRRFHGTRGAVGVEVKAFTTIHTAPQLKAFQNSPFSATLEPPEWSPRN
jgi:hypothetical protein